MVKTVGTTRDQVAESEIASCENKREHAFPIKKLKFEILHAGRCSFPLFIHLRLK